MHKSVKYFFILQFVVLLFSTCKKKEDKSLSSTPPASSYPFSVLQTAYIYVDNSSTVTIDSSAMAAFSQNPTNVFPPTFVQAGNVSLNDSALYFNSEAYENVFPINISQSLKWTITGSGTITPFTHSYIPSYPKYTGGNSLPDTCSKASGITLNISGVTNLQNGITISISQGSSANATKQLSGNGTVFFSASELSSFTTNSSFHLEMVFKNTKTETLGGVLHSFNNNMWYIKNPYLK